MEQRSDEYEIVGYRPEFRNQMLELHKHLWSSDLARNAAYLDWKYFTNPYDSVPVIYLALHEGQVVGTMAAFATYWEVGQPSRASLAFGAADASVDPDHRHRGLMTKMLVAVLQELSSRTVEFIFAFTSNPFSSATFIKLGWRRAQAMQIALGQTDHPHSSRLRTLARRLPLVPSVYRRLRSDLRPSALSSVEQRMPFEAFDRDYAQFGTDRFAHVCVEGVPRPDAMAELVRQIGNEGRMRQVRDKRFFAWRFQNPLSVYRFLFWQDVELEGYLVLQQPVDATKDSWVSIVDWEATTTRARVDLLQAATQWCKSDVLMVWSATFSDTTKALLSESGFHFLDEADSLAHGLSCPSVFVRPVCDDMLHSDWTLAGRRLLEMADWDVRAIYTDDY